MYNARINLGGNMTENEKDMKRWTLFMPDDLLNEIKEVAKAHNITASKLTRIACTKYLAAVKRAAEQEAANAS